MDKAKVYFTDFRTTQDVSLTVKLQKLCRRAGIAEIPFEGKFAAIKMHFGELGNLAFLRPNYAKAVADLVKDLGGKPFLTDCNTLYPGSRKNALDHLYNAEVNGFNSMTTGCYVIIADGLKGTDDIAVPVPNGEFCREAYRPGALRRGRDHLPVSFQGARGGRIRRRDQEYRHGRRQPGGQDAAA